ncbi:uncharacterized protein LOC101845390 isoform X2 [Aplysia californica]|uniref:Uncharacterized protein LOC101845390 isoform X2 n=1 Tax=Aplysia californica TaxID=6500 RepID=A0ABM0JH81_APLCA|nr:uncharacterized protein LOC101845390 isoform X2 [Aplysia californica]
MECDGEDPSSLLSLRETLLPPDTSSSSSSQVLGHGQLHNWTASIGQSVDISGQFSPVSPADGFSNGQNHGEGAMRFYGYHRASAQDGSRNGELSVQGQFPVQNRAVNNGNLSNSLGGFVSSSSHTTTNSCSTLYYTEPDFRPDGDLYSNKDGSRHNSVNGGSDPCSHRVAISQTSMRPPVSHVSQPFSQTLEYTLNAEMPDPNKAGSRSVDLDQSFFDSRMKAGDFPKEMENMYDASTSKQSSKAMAGQDSSLTFDRRQMDISNFDTDFDFATPSRDYGTSAGRVDLSSLHRGAQQLAYHQSMASMDSSSHVTIPQKYSNTVPMSDSNQQYTGVSLPVDSSSPQQPSDELKRVHMAYPSFSFGDNSDFESLRLAEAVQKKPSLSQHFGSISSDLDPVFHATPADVSSHHKYKFDMGKTATSDEFRETVRNPRSSVKETDETGRDAGKWNGRPRAHRKMARLLGGGGLKMRHGAVEVASTSVGAALHAGVEEGGYETMKDQHALRTEVQGKVAYHGGENQRDVTNNSRTFLTMEEELELRASEHEQRRLTSRSRADDADRQFALPKESGLLSSHGLTLDPVSFSMPVMHKDSSLLTDHQFLSGPQLDLDLQHSLTTSSQRELDMNQQLALQVHKDFDMDAGHAAAGPDDLSFDSPMDPAHTGEAELAFSDMNIGGHGQQDLPLEAYFGTGVDRDITFSRKIQTQLIRDIGCMTGSADNDFNFEEYMNSQPQRDLSQPYFDRTDIPQDMTLYQKSPSEKMTVLPDTSSIFKEREKNDGSDLNSMKQMREVSELQKELTKTSAKESMKGIRTPRDLTRALESLQENEKEEARLKEQQQQQQQQHQQREQLESQQQLHQQQHPQQPVSSLVSSPKKTFQTKHQLESMALADQHFLGSTSGFMDEAPVPGLLDSPSLSLSNQHNSAPENPPMMSHYQAFPFLPPPPGEIEMDPSIGGGNKRETSIGHSVNSELDNHILKRLALSSVSHDTASGPPSLPFPSHSASMESVLLETDSTATVDSDVSFQLPVMSGFHNEQTTSETMTDKFIPPGNTATDTTRPRQEMAPMIEFAVRQLLTSDRMHTLTAGSDHRSDNMSTMTQSGLSMAKRESEILSSSRQNLYSMMKQEQFCDAVLSTPNISIKVHQVVLCSLSQELTALLHTMRPPEPSQGSSPSVMLVVNCDSIKSSSLSTFLSLVYVGHGPLTHTNVLDVYVLASSLRMPSVQKLCRDVMTHMRISSSQVKKPQLVVSTPVLKKRDKSCSTDATAAAGGKVYEERAVNTGRWDWSMDASTQTDRSTSEAGERGQEEWVMLKKTKQKTVSPSKSRVLGVKVGVSSDNNPASSQTALKVGKKGCLSPKQTCTSDALMESVSVSGSGAGEILQLSSSATVCPSGKGKDSCVGIESKSDSNSRLEESRIPCVRDRKPNVDDVIVERSTTSSSSSRADGERKKSCFVSSPSVEPKTARTTVEIAEAAAAAKLSAHSYGTRWARGGNRNFVSYAALASGLDRKKVSTGQREKPSSLSKKKEFIKSAARNEMAVCGSELSTPVRSGSGHSKIENVQNLEVLNSAEGKDPVSIQFGKSVGVTEVTKVPDVMMKHPDSAMVRQSAKRSFKKSIVHRSCSEEVLKDSIGKDNLQTKSVTAENARESVGDLKSIRSSSFGIPDRSNVSDSEIWEGGSNSVSHLLESIVNNMGSEDADLQKVIRDLDSELRTSPSSASGPPASASTLSVSSPLRSLQPPEVSPPPSKIKITSQSSTPQGFRKRLIQQMNSEKSGASSSMASSQQPLSQSIVNNAVLTTSSESNLLPVTFDSLIAASCDSGVSSACGVTSSGLSVNVSSVRDALMTSCMSVTSGQAPAKNFEAATTAPSGLQTLNVSSVGFGRNPGTEENSRQLVPATSSMDVSPLSDPLSAATGLRTSNKSPVSGKSAASADGSDRDLASREEDSHTFHHKIFKRNRRTKVKKSLLAEDVGLGNVKVKVKKLHLLEIDGGLGLSKVRQRKHTGSDTEGGSSSGRSKQKKSLSSEVGGFLSKVRPPPKKRAKMELEFLRASGRPSSDERLECDGSNKNVVADQLPGADVHNPMEKCEKLGRDSPGDNLGVPKASDSLQSCSVDPCIDSSLRSVVTKDPNLENEASEAERNTASLTAGKNTSSSVKGKHVSAVGGSGASNVRGKNTPAVGGNHLTSVRGKNNSTFGGNSAPNVEESDSVLDENESVCVLNKSSDPLSVQSDSVEEEASARFKQKDTLAEESFGSSSKKAERERMDGVVSAKGKKSAPSGQVRERSAVTVGTVKSSWLKGASTRAVPRKSFSKPMKRPTIAEKSKAKESTVMKKQKSKENSSKSRKVESVVLPSSADVRNISVETELTLLLEQRSKSDKPQRNHFICKLCQAVVKSARRTIKHVLNHGTEPDCVLEQVTIGQGKDVSQSCELCGYHSTVGRAYYLHYHRYFKHGMPLPPGWSSNRCDICDKECHTKFMLKEHQRTHQSQESGFTCPHCGQAFQNRNSFNNHIFHKHSKDRKHQCKVCEKSFKTWTQLKVHFRSHTGNRPFSCPECDYSSTTQGNMKNHLKGKHSFDDDRVNVIIKKLNQENKDLDPAGLAVAMQALVEKMKTDPSLKYPNQKRKSDGGKSGLKKSAASGKSGRSRFEGSRIQRLLTQPLSTLQPPTLVLPSVLKNEGVACSEKSSVRSGQVKSEKSTSVVPINTSTVAMPPVMSQETVSTTTAATATALLPAKSLLLPLSQSKPLPPPSVLCTVQTAAATVGVGGQESDSLLSCSVIPVQILPAPNLDSSSMMEIPCTVPHQTVSFGTAADMLASSVAVMNHHPHHLPTVHWLQTDGSPLTSVSAVTLPQEPITILNTGQGHSLLTGVDQVDSRVEINGSTASLVVLPGPAIAESSGAIAAVNSQLSSLFPTNPTACQPMIFPVTSDLCTVPTSVVSVSSLPHHHMVQVDFVGGSGDGPDISELGGELDIGSGQEGSVAEQPADSTDVSPPEEVKLAGSADLLGVVTTDQSDDCDGTVAMCGEQPGSYANSHDAEFLTQVIVSSGVT